jgi:hypothetical protein
LIEAHRRAGGKVGDCCATTLAGLPCKARAALVEKNDWNTGAVVKVPDRFCAPHRRLYDKEVKDQGGAEVILFVVPAQREAA